MSGIGHNGGPTMEPGFGFRKLAWTKARASLLPTLPLEVVRIRVARAKRLGLPYRTYATIRATSGRDIVAFLFSGNALEVTPQRIVVPGTVGARLDDLSGQAERIGAIYAPVAPDLVRLANPERLDAAARAPAFTETWSATRAQLRAVIRAENLPLDGVVLVSATAVERDWCGAAGLAGQIEADAFFGRTA
ncbi:MAG: hypothetical protein AAF376_10275 [Pseudomonadota bacterium]